MSINDLTLEKRYLRRLQKEKEDEIRQILKILNDVKTAHLLLSGRDFWVNLYNKKVKYYKLFCDENTLKTAIFIKVIE